MGGMVELPAGRLTISAACQESLLIRRDDTLLFPEQAR
jgi:hypothetical protein